MIVTYSFFEKRMASAFCLMKSAAMAESAKEAILSQEILRRLFNTSKEEHPRKKEEILDKFEKKLKLSGYNNTERKKIFRRGICNYEKLLDLEFQGKRPLHREGRTTVATRYKENYLAKPIGTRQGKKIRRQEHGKNPGRERK